MADRHRPGMKIAEFVAAPNAARPVDIQTNDQIEAIAEEHNLVANAAPYGAFLYFNKLRGSRVIEIEDEYAIEAIIVEVHNEVGSTWDLFVPVAAVDR